MTDHVTGHVSGHLGNSAFSAANALRWPSGKPRQALKPHIAVTVVDSPVGFGTKLNL